eukprot:12428419-Karenia_brevis.AAC.1
MILGDFNVIPERSAVIRTACATGCWYDTAAHCAHMHGTAPCATCFTKRAEGRRIDAILCNRICVTSLMASG